MSDYISREAVQKCFDAECAKCKEGRKYGPDDGLCFQCVLMDVMHDAKDIPAADARTIVYCRDCKHADQSLLSGCVYCNEMERARINEGWCAWGEPKEEQT